MAEEFIEPQPPARLPSLLAALPILGVGVLLLVPLYSVEPLLLRSLPRSGRNPFFTAILELGTTGMTFCAAPLGAILAGLGVGWHSAPRWWLRGVAALLAGTMATALLFLGASAGWLSVDPSLLWRLSASTLVGGLLSHSLAATAEQSAARVSRVFPLWLGAARVLLWFLPALILSYVLVYAVAAALVTVVALIILAIALVLTVTLLRVFGFVVEHASDTGGSPIFTRSDDENTEGRRSCGDVDLPPLGGSTHRRTGWGGTEYFEHLDEDGKVTSTSHRRTGWGGTKYFEHLDEDGRVTSTSHQRTGWGGTEYTEHTDRDGKVISVSHEATDWGGGTHIDHEKKA